MWILPTLNRPGQCAAVLKRIKDSGCLSAGIVFINGKQDTVSEYHTMDLPDQWLKFIVDENIGALGTLNKVFELYPNEDFYGFIGDDEFLLPETPDNWDEILIQSAGDWDFSHGYDNLHHGRRAQGYLCVGGKLARAVGYLAIPDCWHWYGLDGMWEALSASKLCRDVLAPEVKVEHRHPLAGGKSDACYELGASRRDIDQQHFFYWMRNELPKVAVRIQQARRRG